MQSEYIQQQQQKKNTIALKLPGERAALVEVCALGVLLVDLTFQAPFTEMQQFEKEILTWGQLLTGQEEGRFRHN